MTYTIFSRLCADALDQPDLDLYIAERGYQDDWMPQYTDDQVAGILTDIHTCVRSSDFSDIVRISGLSRRAFAIKHGIPVRTADNWATDTGANKHSAPEYVMQLLLFAAISDKYQTENTGLD